jgi:hypothetical protein
MKSQLKQSKQFQPVTLEITFETLDEMKVFAERLTYDKYNEPSQIYALCDHILEYIKNHYDDTVKGQLY